MRQPLAGEYAARRAVLEELPFPAGYSVETTHLIDFLRRFGVHGLAQADLERRVHRTRPLEDLGRMSDAILRSVLARLPGELPSAATGLEGGELERPPFRAVLPMAGTMAES
jgi:glucosyl-3-phosphoglycerate synthase